MPLLGKTHQVLPVIVQHPPVIMAAATEKPRGKALRPRPASRSSNRSGSRRPPRAQPRWQHPSWPVKPTSSPASRQTPRFAIAAAPLPYAAETAISATTAEPAWAARNRKVPYRYNLLETAGGLTSTGRFFFGMVRLVPLCLTVCTPLVRRWNFVLSRTGVLITICPLSCVVNRGYMEEP